MANLQITCKVHDVNEIITHVGIGIGSDNRYSVEQIYDLLKSETNTYYTEVNGKRANVKIGISSNGKKYLTTRPDGSIYNNLDELSPC